MNHSHSSHSTDASKAFFIGISLNLTYVVIEFFYGFLSNSMALIADAGHNLQDVLTLSLSVWALILAKKPATTDLTYGYKKVTILSSLAGGLILAGTCGAIIVEAIGRLSHPQLVTATTMVWVSLIGVVINAGSAFLFFQHRDELNSKAALLHLLADAGISLSVAIAGIVMIYHPLPWLDPALSIAVTLIIFLNTWTLLRDSFFLAIDAVPKGIEIKQVEQAILNITSIKRVHHIHIWPLSTMESALTAHIQVESVTDNKIVNEVARMLEHDFGIKHSTLQVEILTLNSTCSQYELIAKEEK